MRVLKDRKIKHFRSESAKLLKEYEKAIKIYGNNDDDELLEIQMKLIESKVVKLFEKCKADSIRSHKIIYNVYVSVYDAQIQIFFDSKEIDETLNNTELRNNIRNMYLYISREACKVELLPNGSYIGDGDIIMMVRADIAIAEGEALKIGCITERLDSDSNENNEVMVNGLLTMHRWLKEKPTLDRGVIRAVLNLDGKPCCCSCRKSILCGVNIS